MINSRVKVLVALQKMSKEKNTCNKYIRKHDIHNIPVCIY